MRKLLTVGLAAIFLAIPLAASAQDAYTTRSVNVRAGPDTSYPLVGSLGPGTPVQVLGCIDDWSWCDVGFGYNRGWVYAPYLNYVYQGARVPFYSYAPAFGIPIVAFSLGSYWDRHYRGRSWYGRRDYWERREPVHVRPAGPPPRATLPSIRERAEYRQPRTPEYTGKRETQTGRDYRPPRDASNREMQTGRDYRPPRDASIPSPDRRGAQVVPQTTLPVPSTTHPPQEMRRASPTQQPAPLVVRDGGQRGGEKPRAEGEKVRGREPEGNKP